MTFNLSARLSSVSTRIDDSFAAGTVEIQPAVVGSRPFVEWFFLDIGSLATGQSISLRVGPSGSERVIKTITSGTYTLEGPIIGKSGDRIIVVAAGSTGVGLYRGTFGLLKDLLLGSTETQ